MLLRAELVPLQSPSRILAFLLPAVSKTEMLLQPVEKCSINAWGMLGPPQSLLSLLGGSRFTLQSPDCSQGAWRS